MIKRVYQNQAQVWEDMHKDRTLGIECGCSPDEAPRRLYTMMTRLEEDAHSVRESVRYSHYLFNSFEVSESSAGGHPPTIDSGLGKH